MFKLAAVFENAAGRNHRWSYNNPDPTKAPEKIKEALETMTTLNLFQKDGVRQFYKVVSAKFVETIETPIFDLSQQTETYVADPNNAFAPFIIADKPTQVSELAQEVATVEEPKAAVTEQPAAVEAAPATIAAPAPKFVPEKPAIRSQSKAALDTTLVDPAAFSAKAPVMNADSVAKSVEKAAKTPVQADPSEQRPEAPVTESPAVKKAANSRKEKLDQLRAFHEANKKKKRKKR